MNQIGGSEHNGGGGQSGRSGEIGEKGLEIAGRTGKHFCTTHELREYKEVLLYYVALCMKRMWEYKEALLYYAYFWYT